MADKVTFHYNNGRVLVSISQDTATARTVQIGDYAKIITEQSQIIDITNYIPTNVSSIIRTGGMRYVAGTAYEIKVLLDNTPYIAPMAFIPNAPNLYVGDKMRDGWLSDLPYLLNTKGYLFSCSIGNVGSGYNVYTGNYKLDTNNSDKTDVYQFNSVAVSDGNYKLIMSVDKAITEQTIKYEIPVVSKPLGLNGVRIAWINRYGCVDFWNFDFCRERKLAVEAKKIYTGNAGYKTLGATAETTYTVETRELTQEILAALSQILYSPAVWTVGADGTTKEIDIITDECRIFSDTELSTLQLEYRPKMRDL